MIASGERIGTTATLHPSNCDWPAGAKGRNLTADKIEVAHVIEVGVICDTDCAIAGAELGTKIELNFGATIGRLAVERSARSPLIDGKRPIRLSPDRTSRCWDRKRAV